MKDNKNEDKVILKEEVVSTIAEDLNDNSDDEFLKKTKKNIVSTIITALFVLIAIGAVVGVVVIRRNDSANDRYNPSQTEQEELKLACQELLMNNYNIIRMFYEEGLSVVQNVTVDESTLVTGSAGAEEMQNYKVNLDNIYTVDDPTYKTYDQIVEFVNATLVPDAANDLLTNGQGNGPVYCDKDGALGINKNNFEPIPYDKNWSSITCEYKNITDNTADVFVTLPYSDSSEHAGESVTLSGNLIKTEYGWRLEKLIY